MVKVQVQSNKRSSVKAEAPAFNCKVAPVGGPASEEIRLLAELAGALCEEGAFLCPRQKKNLQDCGKALAEQAACLSRALHALHNPLLIMAPLCTRVKGTSPIRTDNRGGLYE